MPPECEDISNANHTNLTSSDYNRLMTAFRRILMVLAIINVFFTFFTATIGLFADGGDVWSRLILSALHPLSALAILALVFLTLNSTIVTGIAAVLALHVVADATLATMIASGAVKGDWELSIVFSIIPIIALIYAVASLRDQPKPSSIRNRNDSASTGGSPV